MIYLDFDISWGEIWLVEVWKMLQSLIVRLSITEKNKDGKLGKTTMTCGVRLRGSHLY